MEQPLQPVRVPEAETLLLARAAVLGRAELQREALQAAREAAVEAAPQATAEATQGRPVRL